MGRALIYKTNSLNQFFKEICMEISLENLYLDIFVV